MIARGEYVIKQIDQTLPYSSLREKAIEEIARSMVSKIMSESEDQIVQEVPNSIYPYGRFVLDIEFSPAEL